MQAGDVKGLNSAVLSGSDVFTKVRHCAPPLLVLNVWFAYIRVGYHDVHDLNAGAW